MNIKENILGVDVSNMTYESLTADVLERIDSGEQSFIVAVNPEKIMKASKSPELMDILNTADYQIPDGIGLLIASKLKKGSIKARITGVDLMMHLVEAAALEEKSIFLYGGKPGVGQQAADKLLEKYPALQIAGVLDGYIKDNEVIKVAINEASPDFVFVAMGSPKQEEWIIANKSSLEASVFQGVGGSFDVIAGNVKRAPAFFRKYGLEWLYRLLKEPKRLGRQLALPQFVMKVLFHK